MMATYAGAALFLAGSLALTIRDVLPASHRCPDSSPAGPAGLRVEEETRAVSRETSSRRISLPILLSVSTLAALLAGLAVVGRWGERSPAFATTLVVALPVCVALAVIDVDVHRLPNRLTGSLAAVTTAGVLLGTLTGMGADRFDAGLVRRAFAGALLLGACYLVLALLGGGQGMGLGDVKLAPSLGALAAWAGWPVWLSAAVLPFVLGGLWGLVLLMRGRGRHARMPFGPFMIAGTLLAVGLG